MRYSVIYDAEKAAYTPDDHHRHGPFGEWHYADSMPFDRWESDDNCFHHATGMVYEYCGYSYTEYVDNDGRPYLD